jgi:hypothetical protein
VVPWRSSTQSVAVEQSKVNGPPCLAHTDIMGWSRGRAVGVPRENRKVVLRQSRNSSCKSIANPALIACNGSRVLPSLVIPCSLPRGCAVIFLPTLESIVPFMLKVTSLNRH